MPRVGVLGLGAVGAQVTRQLLATGAVDEVVVSDVDQRRLSSRAEELGPGVTVAASGLDGLDGLDAVALCTPAGHHLEPARRAVLARIPVVSISDRPSEVRSLLTLGARAARRGTWVIAAAGFSPGVSCLLARWLAREFDVVDEIHVAKDGTGGPACARQHHRALKSPSLDWRDGEWTRRPGGSGRELAWFPEPVSAADCYRAALADALVLQPVFSDARRITARLSASRQDRFTSWLPMLTPPHADGGVGAVRVEVRGRREGMHQTRVAGGVATPSTAAAAMVGVVVERLLASDAILPMPGAFGVAKLADPGALLRELRGRGITLQEFVGLGL